MDKNWVRLNRLTDPYKVGLNNFLEIALQRSVYKGHAKCPCRRCRNRYWHNRSKLFEHLIVSGMDPKYMDVVWEWHGESHSAVMGSQTITIDEREQNDMQQLLNEVLPNHLSAAEDGDNPSHPSQAEGRMPEVNRFYNLVEDANSDLYPGCKNFKKLEFIVKLYHIKALNGWSDKSFSTLLQLFKEALPEGETLPKSFYQTKKLIGELGLTYEKIDACRNDCMLYWPQGSPEYTSTTCSHCGVSRWKDDSKRVPAKVFRYFPLTPRLQRLYMSTHTAGHMRWHDEGRTKDGVLRHPADSEAWKKFDERHLEFGLEVRNVRLGLASDGFNPFGKMSNAHSTWPVVLAVYNLPPWMCMKQPYLLMSSLISGPKGPGTDIDVYLQPLIHELNQLWHTGVSTYDVSTNQTFQLRAALLWTINDFPAYANLSGWSTKGKYACPHCNMETCSKWLINGRKFSYMGHRRFLPPNHRYRRQRAPFNNKQELASPPLKYSGTRCLEQLRALTFTVGKGKASLKHRRSNTRPWKKKSIFFSLPYWEHNLLRHNLDVMHIEKNVCDSVVGTLLAIEGKTKDGLKARADLKMLKIKKPLWPIVNRGGHTRIPPAQYTLTREKKKLFCKVLSSVKLPDGYAGNLARCVDVESMKIFGWKSHDCHVVMQELLPLAIRHVLPNNVLSALKEFSAFFNALCSKTATPEDFMKLSSKIELALCDMEKIFPPSFFDIMVHLPVHLAYEAAIAGPVQYRWMYPIERYLYTLKGYVRNNNHPEGCIAEGYLVEECLSFCSMYLQDIETRRTRQGRNTTPMGRSVPGALSIFGTSGRSLGKEELFQLDSNLWDRARRYVLFNCSDTRIAST